MNEGGWGCFVGLLGKTHMGAQGLALGRHVLHRVAGAPGRVAKRDIGVYTIVVLGSAQARVTVRRIPVVCCRGHVAVLRRCVPWGQVGGRGRVTVLASDGEDS